MAETCLLRGELSRERPEKEKPRAEALGWICRDEKPSSTI
jgi:hypothetical protein